MQKIFIKDIQEGSEFVSTFMVMKIVIEDKDEIVAFLGDKTGDIKAVMPNKETVKVGDILKVNAVKEEILKISDFTRIDKFEIKEYLPVVNKSIDKIMDEIDLISKQEFKSEEAKCLDNYFFGNESFVEKFKSGIAGLRQHHNYIGGLAEHTLNVMYLAKTLSYRYDIRYKEIAILASKLHDIGKIIEYNTQGPFTTTLEGDLKGHIVIGSMMIEEAFKSNPSLYSDEFKNRILACIIQHHGKVEYGSPKAANTEESFIVHYADYVDANLNKIEQIRNITEKNTWSEYDRRIGTRLYM
ncbi:3'-5' exoribonuclease [Alkalithermobacter thermoalcaliphilus JW-YL-7 = DSM 7308]|uniref:3'-5' exoribonuclease n=1 Tax=Alkalithermobacter thermoalcaliphilus JW-YL-7 = DSM 7308 TaxID=1121328 RepID=A0A150FQ67_CLOPD|nr:metal dependent phosphohydrolase [[Clostridium] paradoxum JW-YL-7 = DSM 7308]SHK61757.1 3'-5' exoribonuclease [[Clostridium] paradoxum JW-YL-7 = DSM 7308]